MNKNRSDSSPSSGCAAPILMLAALGLCGCVSTADYPAAWPTQSHPPVEACEPLRGSFQNLGTWAVSDEIDERILASLFFPLGQDEPTAHEQDRRDVTHVTFDAGETGSVIARGWIADTPRFERVLMAPDFLCEEGRWVFRDTTWEAEGMVGSVARVASRYEMGIAEDGSLIMEQREIGAGELDC